MLLPCSILGFVLDGIFGCGGSYSRRIRRHTHGLYFPLGCFLASILNRLISDREVNEIPKLTMFLF